MATIQQLYAREILDSRGLPTIECSIWLDTGQMATTSVPSGSTIGKYAAVELRDGDINRMVGKGVLQAVNGLNTIIGPNLIGQDPTKQLELDQMMINLDGTPNKAKLGVNAILAASQAIAKAGALASNMQLYYYLQQHYQLTDQFVIPNCVFSMFNGGSHGADNLDIQDFHILPASHLDYIAALNMAVTVYRKLEEVLISKEAIHCVGSVGGFAPHLYSNTDSFEILTETIKATPYTFAQDLFFGVDISANNIYENGKYILKDKPQPYTAAELVEYYRGLRTAHQVIFIEDPFIEDDVKSWQKLTEDLGNTTRIVGDRLLVTNKEKTAEAIKQKLCNTLIIKPNQIGTVSETIEVTKLAKDAGWYTVVSNRSGETNDDFLADLSVGIGANYAKFGAPNRGERVAKFNRFLEIFYQLNPPQATQTQQVLTNTGQVQQAQTG